MADITKYAAMAKLKLAGSELDWVSSRADRLAESFEALEKIDVDGVSPLITVLEIQNVLREDVAEQLVSREELLENSPEQYDGYFQVPKTLE